MFDGLRFQARTATILNEQFSYDGHKFSREQKWLYKGICKDFQSKGGNEYDVAGHFMAIMVDSVNDKRAYSEKLKNWIHQAARLIPFMRLEQAKPFVFDVLEKTNRELA